MRPPRQIGEKAVELFNRLRGNVRVGNLRGYRQRQPRHAGFRRDFDVYLRWGRPKSESELMSFQEFLSAYNLDYVMDEHAVNDALSEEKAQVG